MNAAGPVTRRPLGCDPARARPVEDFNRVAGDHRFLVGGDDEHAHARALGGDHLSGGAVRGAIQFDADPLHAFQHALAHAPGVLADAAAEHHGVEALQHRRQAAEFAADAEDEIFDRLLPPPARPTPPARACRATRRTGPSGRIAGRAGR